MVESGLFSACGRCLCGEEDGLHEDPKGLVDLPGIVGQA
jgi:hypothetical protein